MNLEGKKQRGQTPTKKGGGSDGHIHSLCPGESKAYGKRKMVDRRSPDGPRHDRSRVEGGGGQAEVPTRQKPSGTYPAGVSRHHTDSASDYRSVLQ